MTIYDEYKPLEWTLKRILGNVDDTICLRHSEPASKYYFTTADKIVNYGFNPVPDYLDYIGRCNFPLNLSNLLKEIENVKKTDEKGPGRGTNILLEGILKSQILDKIYPETPHHLGEKEGRGETCGAFNRIISTFKSNLVADDKNRPIIDRWFGLLNELLENYKQRREIKEQKTEYHKLVSTFNFFSAAESDDKKRDDFEVTIANRILPGIKKEQSYFKVLVVDDFFCFHLPIFLAAEKMVTGPKSNIPLIHFSFECIPEKAKTRCQNEKFDLILLDIDFGDLDEITRKEEVQGDICQDTSMYTWAKKLSLWANEQDPKILVINFSRFKEIVYYKELLGNVKSAIEKEDIREKIIQEEDIEKKRDVIRDVLIKPLLEKLLDYYQVRIFKHESAGSMTLQTLPASPIKRIGVYDMIDGDIFNPSVMIKIDSIVSKSGSRPENILGDTQIGDNSNVLSPILQINDKNKNDKLPPFDYSLIPFINEEKNLSLLFLGKIPIFIDDYKYLGPILERLRSYDMKPVNIRNMILPFETDYKYETLLITLAKYSVGDEEEYPFRKWEGLDKDNFITALDKDMEYIVVPVFNKMSLLDIIGPIMIGPSSSHTAGANRIARIARNFAESLLKKENIEGITVDMLNSFASTGRGHGSNRAIAAGLQGLKQYDLKLPSALPEPKNNKDKKQTVPPGITLADDFEITIDSKIIKVRFSWNKAFQTELHNNSIRFKYNRDHENTGHNVAYVLTACSWGGGNVQVSSIKKGDGTALKLKDDQSDKGFNFSEDELKKNRDKFSGKDSIWVKYPEPLESVDPKKKNNGFIEIKPIYYDPKEEIKDALKQVSLDYQDTVPADIYQVKFVPEPPNFLGLDDLIILEKTTGKSLWEIAVEYELWHMQETAGNKKDQLYKPGDILNIFINYYLLLKRIAESSLSPSTRTYTDFRSSMGYNLKIRSGFSQTGTRKLSQIAMIYAAAVNEANAKMSGLVLAAPTAGSCGIVPGVIMALEEYLIQEGLSEEERKDVLGKGLLTAALVGLVITNIVPPAGATHGCQAEIGTGGAMASAMAAFAMGGDSESCIHAAALSLKNSLGLVCDPIGGKVEVPCIKRAALKAAESITIADMAIKGVKSDVQPSDVVRAMKEIGDNMKTIYKETSRGGLATTLSSRR